MSIVDLGCGTGELTAELSEILPDSEVLGIDSSAEMLEKAARWTHPGLNFELKKIEDVDGRWDLIFSNAALHWVADHNSLIPRLLSLLNPGGQLVVQLPSNHRNRAQTSLAEVAAEEPFQEALGGWKWEFPVLPIDLYAEIIYQNGGRDITIFDKVYPHILDCADDVFTWVSGTTMVPYLERLPDELHNSYKETHS